MAALLLAMVIAAPRASGVVIDGDPPYLLTNCDEVSLRSAIAAGQTSIGFDCDGVIRLGEVLTISGRTRLDARGHHVTLTGSNAVRLFVVESNAFLGLHGLVLADGAATGTNGHPLQPGGAGEGGAVFNRGRLEAVACRFTGHQASGGRGGPGTNGFIAGGSGGPGRGGAIYSQDGILALTNCIFELNLARGGLSGGRSPTGEAQGGALANRQGTVHLSGNVFRQNRAMTGFGSRADGGAIFSTGSTTSRRDEFALNSCLAGSHQDARGGAICQEQGDFEAVGTTLTGNSARGGAGSGDGSFPGGRGLGGAVAIGGSPAWMSHCAFVGNTARGGDSPGVAGSAHGGAVYNGRLLTAFNCTLTDNTARGGESAHFNRGVSEGGGFYNVSEGVLQLTHVTIAGNTATVGGAIASAQGAVVLQNSILANSLAGSNWFGTNLTDRGGNLSSDLSCPLVPPLSFINTDPRLGPLWTYGGSSPSLPLLAGSPAIDAAVAVDDASAPLPFTDQRGRSRPFGPASDSGAFESCAPYFVLGAVRGYMPASGINVGASPGASVATSDNAGFYALGDLAAAEYVVAPQTPDIISIPSNRVVSITADLPGVDFTSYRSNALVIERIGSHAIRGVFAGQPGLTYHVFASTNLETWQPWSTHTVEPSGLFEFLPPGGPTDSARYFRAAGP